MQLLSEGQRFCVPSMKSEKMRDEEVTHPHLTAKYSDY